MALPTTREAGTESILELTKSDEWLLRFALIKALEELDLHHLINLVEIVDDAAKRDPADDHRTLRTLLEERFR